MQGIQQQLKKRLKGEELQAFSKVYRMGMKKHIRYWMYALLLFLMLVLFLPWTQNIRGKGTVTTLRQEQRPQEINTVIGGRITRWFVKEGDLVNAGDTIALLSEIKDDYLDPNLIQRTQEQLNAKRSTIASYGNKALATDAQINALSTSLAIKLRQAALKVKGDSLEAIAATNDYLIADRQYQRQQTMRDSGLVSLTQLEQRNQKYQTAMAKKLSAEVKYNNARTELSQLQQEYAEKVFKAQGERAAAMGELATGEGELAKLSNQYQNYTIRNSLYYIIAPQRGQVVQAAKSGINEIIKEGEKIAQIVPVDLDYAVEMFIKPVDVPLISKGQRVQLLFDGYPTIVFSGWPEASFGTFTGKVVAIERAVNKQGNFRILIAPNNKEKPWPNTLSLGTGANGFALLKDVPLFYELWRNINGFPPEYYKSNPDEDKQANKK